MAEIREPNAHERVALVAPLGANQSEADMEPARALASLAGQAKLALYDTIQSGGLHRCPDTIPSINCEHFG